MSFLPVAIYRETSKMISPSKIYDHAIYWRQSESKFQLSQLGGKGLVAQINRSYDMHVCLVRGTHAFKHHIFHYPTLQPMSTATYKQYQLSNLTNGGVTAPTKIR